MFKYADDTYIVIPARNTQSRGNELDNVEVEVRMSAGSINMAAICCNVVHGCMQNTDNVKGQFSLNRTADLIVMLIKLLK